MSNKWSILRYCPPNVSPDVRNLYEGLPTPDDMRLQWNTEGTIIFLELWYESSSYTDHTTFTDLMEQFNVPEAPH